MEVQEAVGAAIANEDKIIYKDSTYELVSKVAYLIGGRDQLYKEIQHKARPPCYRDQPADFGPNQQL